MLRLVEQSPHLWRLGIVLDTPARQWLGIFPKRLWQLSHSRPAVSKQILNIMSGIFARSRTIRINSCEQKNTNSPMLLSCTKIANQLVALFHMEVSGGRHLFGPFISWPVDTQLAVVSVLYHLPHLPAKLLSSLAVCLNLDAAMDAEVARRIMNVIFHRRSVAEPDELMHKESTEALCDFVLELLLDSKW